MEIPARVEGDPPRFPDILRFCGGLASGPRLLPRMRPHQSPIDGNAVSNLTHQEVDAGFRHGAGRAIYKNETAETPTMYMENATSHPSVRAKNNGQVNGSVFTRGWPPWFSGPMLGSARRAHASATSLYLFCVFRRGWPFGRRVSCSAAF